MLLTWGPVVKLRGVARKLGLTRVLVRFVSSAKYEERFSAAMLGAIRPGDTVWDVGANIGLYTVQFADKAGPQGRVVAFEPVPDCYRQMTERAAGRTNVVPVAAGLGSASGTLKFDVGSSDNTLGRVVVQGATPEAGARILELPVYTGDEAVRGQGLPAPTLAKIDVEGFELDVLKGMPGLLASRTLHDVFVEVHFGILAERGLTDAPGQIVRLLEQAGFTVRWVDPSHVHAARGG